MLQHVFSSSALAVCLVKWNASISLSSWRIPVKSRCTSNHGAFKSLTGSSLTLLLRCVSPRPLHEDGESSTWGRFIFMPVNAWPRVRNAILDAFYRASNGLTTCWALFWFAAAGDGMELTWSFSIWSPCGPVRAALQSGDTTPWHWFTVQGLFFACGLKDNWIMGEAGVERGRLEMDGVRAPGRRDKRDGKTEMSDPFDGFRRLPVPANCSICWWKTEMGALLAVKAARIHWCCKRLGVEGDRQDWRAWLWAGVRFRDRSKKGGPSLWTAILLCDF